ncbi:MAG: winged helix-turn-helix transcriptional regulator [Candidatus Sericytochromatia bacterium]
MNTRRYGQYCGLVHAVELIGERWALLLIRDLLVGPRRFSDLHRSLPKIPTNVLSTRLKELEQAGIVARELLPRPANAVVYTLTPYGRDLEEIVLKLGLWGARSLGTPAPDDTASAEVIQMALRTTFRPSAAGDLKRTYHLVLGDVEVFAQVANGEVSTGLGQPEAADLSMHAGPAFTPLTFKQLLAGALSPAQAVANGELVLDGPPEEGQRFVELFQIPPL